MNKVAKTPLRDTLGGTGIACLCAAGLPFACIASFALAFLLAIAPALSGIANIEEARHLFDSVCMALPHAFDEVLSPAFGCLISG